jgi:hypothetical protein
MKIQRIHGVALLQDVMRSVKAIDRILKHAMTCKALQVHDVQLWEEAVKTSGQGSLGANLDEAVVVEESLEQLQLKQQKVQSSLNIENLQETGKKVKEEQWKLFQSKVDHIIMHLICVWGLIPNLIDSPEWKELMGVLNSIYHPMSADIFADKHIPHEAVYIHKQQIDNLHSINNLKLTIQPRNHI